MAKFSRHSAHQRTMGLGRRMETLLRCPDRRHRRVPLVVSATDELWKGQDRKSFFCSSFLRQRATANGKDEHLQRKSYARLIALSGEVLCAIISQADERYSDEEEHDRIEKNVLAMKKVRLAPASDLASVPC